MRMGERKREKKRKRKRKRDEQTKNKQRNTCREWNKPKRCLEKKNKAGYTTTLVACGWAGAVFELLKHLGKCNEAKDCKNIKKVKRGPPTDRPTDLPTVGPT